MFIYALSYPEGSIRYVGKSIHPHARLKGHMKERYRMKNRRDKWISSLDGKTPFLSIIEEVTELNWQERERFWIAKLKLDGCDLVNGTEGGEGSNGFKGRRHSEETKAKLRVCHLGRKVCPFCFNTYQPKRGSQKYCSQDCRRSGEKGRPRVRGGMPIHGTLVGYSYYKCRCNECKKKHADAAWEHRHGHSRTSELQNPTI